MQKLITKLKSFKLAGMVNSLEARMVYANNNSISHSQFLELLCEDESNNRSGNNYNKRVYKAKLPALKTIEDFDFNFQTSIDKKQISDAVTCQYIEEKRNIIFIGNPGTGKTHLSIALGLKALLNEYKVLFTTVSDMLYKLHISKADNSYYKKLDEYLLPNLLIMDELVL